MNFADQDGFIWMDGEYKPWREATLHVLTHTLHYGMGIFEGIRAYDTAKGPAIFRLQDHIDRFYESAKIINMPIPYEKQDVVNTCCDIIRKNEFKSAYVRPMLFYGSEGMGLHATNLKPHLLIASWKWGAYLGEENMTRGIRIKTSSFTRNHVNSMLGKAKINGHYVNSMLALQEAQACGYDEALMLDHRGFVAEGSGENFFMVRDKVLFTPPITCVLEGITRETIIKLARDLGMEVIERNFTRDEVYIADEAFFTGTAAEVTPIRELDGRVIGEGRRGPVTEILQGLYFEQVFGRREENNEWLTYVEG